MNFDVQWVDVNPFLLNRVQPVFLFRREPVMGDRPPKAWAGSSQLGTLGEFYVPTTDLYADKIEFALTRIGEAVRIPMYGYKTVQRAHSAIFGLGLQIGLTALVELRKHTDEVPLVAHLVLGHEVSDIREPDECFCCYVGMAFRTK